MSHQSYHRTLRRFLALLHDLGKKAVQPHISEFVPVKPPIAFLTLSEAVLCSDCETIGNSISRCPRCGSDALLAISRVIPRHQDSIRLVCSEPEPEPDLEPCCSVSPFYRPEKRNWFQAGDEGSRHHVIRK